MIDIKGVLIECFKKFLIKRLQAVLLKMKNVANQALAEELHKQLLEHFLILIFFREYLWC